ncbi:MAG: c-type cytochrome [Ilumatobacteraceae bacterium]|jgi:cytochrome c oxidase subunit 2
MNRVAVALLSAVLLLGCSAASDEANTLSPEAAEGQATARSNGCAACHGADGQGGVGPAFVGLYLSDRELVDGSIVVADRDYLYESITQPAAKLVAGYRGRMPSNNLDDAQVESIMAWIEELAAP